MALSVYQIYKPSFLGMPVAVPKAKLGKWCFRAKAKMEGLWHHSPTLSSNILGLQCPVVIFSFLYLFIGCIGSSLLRVGFL